MSEKITSEHRLPEAPFGRVITAMVTPFTDDLSAINYVEAQNLANRLLDRHHGSDGLVIAGTTGDSTTISHDEQRQLFREIDDAVADAPIIAGVGSNNTTEAVGLTEFVTENKLADAVLAVSPYYNRPGQDGIYDYFAQIAKATDLPVIIYNIPVRTGEKVENSTLLELANDFPNIRGLKDATGDPMNTAKILRHPDLPEGFFVYSGDDMLNLQLAKDGAVGAISVASHWAGKEISQMFKALDVGDEETAERIHRRLIPSFEFETSPEARNPLPTKAMLRALGYQATGYGRSPIVLRTNEQYQALEARALKVHTELQSYSN